MIIKNSTELLSDKYSTIMKYEIEPPIPISGTGMFIGYDPGTTNVGIAVIWGELVTVYEAKVVRYDNAVKRILEAQLILSQCIHLFEHNSFMTIEGSSFSRNFREAELAEVRASAVLWAIAHHVTPSIIQPNSIRKVVFGSGKTKAEDVWKELPNDAASALACAYHSFINASTSTPSTKR